MSHLSDSNSYPDGYRALNTSELRELLQDEAKMDQIVLLNEKFQELQVGRDALLTSNRSLAEDSLACRPRLNNGKLQLAHKYGELSLLASACRDKHSQLEAQVQKRSLQTAQNLLQDGVARAEERSEELLERFMEGNVPLDDFLDSFQSSRKAYHVRRAQAEKVQELGRAARQGGGAKRPDKREDKEQEVQKDPAQRHHQEPHRPNGFVAQGPPPPQGPPPRVFQLRYGLTPAILLPHFPLPPPSSSSSSSSGPHAGLPPLDPLRGAAHILGGPGGPLSGQGQAVGLRVIGQLPGGWPAHGRPLRFQQLYRPSPHHPEPPYR